MNHSVFWALVRKDLYLLRGFMIAAISTGVLAILLAITGKIGFAIGGVLFITANIGGGIYIAMYSLLTERKDQSRLFALSLPISGAHYERAKLTSVCLAYGIPWLVLTAMAVALFLLAPGATRGMVVYVLMLQGFVLALSSVVLAALFVTSSEMMAGVVIMTVNILFSLFMVTINQPAIAGPLRGPTINWSSFSVVMLTCEFAVLALSLGFALFITGRRRDYL